MRLLILLVCLPLFASDYSTYNKYDSNSQIEAEVRLGNLAHRTDFALDKLMQVASREMDRRGHGVEANTLRRDFMMSGQGYLERHTDKNRFRNIGDFEPLSKKLTQWYKDIENVIGRSACKTLHISDLYVLNHAIPIVFNPCKHTILDFEDHFRGDVNYSGLFPIVCYWGTFAACEVGTGGVGTIAWFCGAVGAGSEYISENFIAGGLADDIYVLSCL